ncbi:MAG: ABC transporter ATP-binding protein [Candidatus Heimdallarchaeota archaeon]
MTEILLDVRNLTKHFELGKGLFAFLDKRKVHAIDNITFTVNRGTTLGLVGESGCGKTTTGKCILRLIEPTSGEISFDGIELIGLKKKDLMHVRRRMQLIFQNPFSSLDPRMQVKDIISEPLRIHRMGTTRERTKRVQELLELVELSPDHANRYPHEFSGGQKQRIAIARALALNPTLIIADEPVSALDVSIQAQILNLMNDLQKEFGLTYLFIAHDISVIKYMSDMIAVMYLGQIVEMGERIKLLGNPQHPYTKALLSAIPIPNPRHKKDRIILRGDVPNPIHPPSGCRFHPRCPMAEEKCACKKPRRFELEKNHFVSCFLHY